MPDSFDQAASLLRDYVTFGAMRTPDQFDSRFEVVARTLPRGLKSAPDVAWRAATLPQDRYAELRAGRPVSFEPRLFASWTGSKAAALRLLRERCLAMPRGHVGLLIERPIEPDTVAANVRDVYSHSGWVTADSEEWARYVEWEHELIIRSRPGDEIVQPAHVVMAESGRSLLNDGESKVLRPHVGERFWIVEEDCEATIQSVGEIQPYTRQGVWEVTSTDGLRCCVAMERFGWEVAEDYEPVRDLARNSRP